MQVISEHAEYAVRAIMHTIGQDSGSWEGWQCLRIETSGLSARGNRSDIQSDFCSILEGHLQDKDGTVFLCGFGEALIFCKGVPELTLKSIGSQVLERLAENGLQAEVTFFNVCEDSLRLVDLYASSVLPETKTSLSFKVRPFRLSGSRGTRAGQPPGASGRKVLLVEDDPAMRWMVRSVLKGECELVTAQDVHGAVSLYRAYKPDVVLLDLNLCGKDGKEAMAHIIQSDPGAHILIFSGQDSIENITCLLEEGAKGFIAKPFRKEKLLQYIHNAPHLRM